MKSISRSVNCCSDGSTVDMSSVCQSFLPCSTYVTHTDYKHSHRKLTADRPDRIHSERFQSSKLFRATASNAAQQMSCCFRHPRRCWHLPHGPLGSPRIFNPCFLLALPAASVSWRTAAWTRLLSSSLSTLRQTIIIKTDILSAAQGSQNVCQRRACCAPAHTSLGAR